MKPIFKTDLALIVLGLLSLTTGVAIHFAHHFLSHGVWHNWSIVHIIINILLLIFVGFHVKQHWGWFKALVKKSSFRKKISFFIMMAFIAVVLSGAFLLVFCKGQGSHAGLVHYYLGVLFSVLVIIHVARRFKVLIKGIKSKK